MAAATATTIAAAAATAATIATAPNATKSYERTQILASFTYLLTCYAYISLLTYLSTYLLTTTTRRMTVANYLT